jgi:hypothetical protein
MKEKNATLCERLALQELGQNKESSVLPANEVVSQSL